MGVGEQRNCGVSLTWATSQDPASRALGEGRGGMGRQRGVQDGWGQVRGRGTNLSQRSREQDGERPEEGVAA